MKIAYVSGWPTGHSRSTPLHEAADRTIRLIEDRDAALHRAPDSIEPWFGEEPMVTRHLHDVVIQDVAQDLVPDFQSC